jgi:hypothetical protein
VVIPATDQFESCLAASLVQTTGAAAEFLLVAAIDGRHLAAIYRDDVALLRRQEERFRTTLRLTRYAGQARVNLILV